MTQKTDKKQPNPKVGLGKTSRRLSRKRCRYSSLEKFEDGFDTALHSMQTKPLYAVFSAIW